MSARTASAREARPGSLALYRDDGPIARALGNTLGRAVELEELAVVLVACVPLFAAIAFLGDEASQPLAGAAIAWAVVWGGAASGSPPGGSLRWALLPVLRASEYAALLWLAAIAGSNAVPAAFALLAALAFRHYDLVYRMRLRAVAPPRWVNALSLGWDGRLIAAYVLLVVGALPVGLFAAAAVLGVAFVAEAVSLWAGVGGGAGQPLELEGEEDEDK
jgi:hypothetical protein